MTAAVEARQGRPPIIDQLERSAPELERLGIDPNRFARTVATEIRKNPKLAQCDPASVLGAVFTCAQLDLEPGPGGYAWLVPYGSECTFILGYRGMVELARRVDVTVTVGSVYEGDRFHERGGTDPDIEHVHGPNHGIGDPIRWYAVAHLPNGLKVTRSLTRDQVEHRRQSGNSANSPAWKNHYDAMARKSAIRALWSTLPMGMSRSMRLAESADGTAPRIVDGPDHAADDDGDTGDVEVVETVRDHDDDPVDADEVHVGGDHLPGDVVLEVEHLRPDAGLTDDGDWSAWLTEHFDVATLDDVLPDEAKDILTALREKASG